jgi:glycerol-3-phosphate dehydrogenase subunit C
MIKTENISFDHCIKCTFCNVYCPVARTTPLFPGPKQDGPDAERLRIKNPLLIDESVKYCTNCKRCEIACPSDVKIADIIHRAKQKHAARKIQIRESLLSRLDMLLQAGIPLRKIFNPLMKNRPARYLLDKSAGINSEIRMPLLEKERFDKRLARIHGDQSGFKEHVIYFPGCNVNFMDHNLGDNIIHLFNAMEIGVIIPENRCCGVPAIANSRAGKAASNARFNLRSLSDAIKKTGCRAVISCSSGSLAIKHEYRNLLNMDNSFVDNNTDYITTYLHRKFDEGRMPALKPLPLRAVYHAPCHLEKMGGVIHTLNVLRRIPGLELRILNSQCCGISGTFGFKSEYAEISRSIGERLFSLIERESPEVVITDCVTCKWQIESFTGYRVLHPVNLLAAAI